MVYRIRQERHYVIIVVFMLLTFYFYAVLTHKGDGIQGPTQKGYLNRMLDDVGKMFRRGKDETSGRESLRKKSKPIVQLGSLEQRGLQKPLILLYTRYYDHYIWPGINLCPSDCDITTNKSLIEKADLVLFQGWQKCYETDEAESDLRCVGWDEPNEIWDWPGRQVAGQVWLYDSLESQDNTASASHLQFADYVFNYTSSFKASSTIMRSYGSVIKGSARMDRYDYLAHNKTKLALWLVSHCGVPMRDKYAAELRQHLNFDEFGRCSGNRDDCYQLTNPYDKEACVRKLKAQYKFYLAFENSICDEYITEKFWKALDSGLVPITLGANMDDYTRVAPPNSFIHVDNFTSAQALAEYIKYLDTHDEAYNAYHRWREENSIESNFPRDACKFCRLAAEKPKSTIKLSDWWNADNQCRKTTPIAS